jgi:DNA-binding response OmpR family regulator
MTKKIMVVDDDPNIVQYITAILEDAGYETCSASDGSDAFELLKKEMPDLITLDLDMPEEWGTRFYRRYSKRDEYKDIPVIVVSGLSGINHAINSAVAVVRKPFEPDELLGIIRKTIGS